MEIDTNANLSWPLVRCDSSRHWLVTKERVRDRERERERALKKRMELKGRSEVEKLLNNLKK